MSYFDQDFSKYKGTEVLINGIECFIADIDYDKGISAVEMDNPDNEVFCINKSDIERYSQTHGKDYNYNGDFALAVRWIKKGIFNVKKNNICLNRKKNILFSSSMVCAFK